MLPHDCAFTWAQAQQLGLARRELSALIEQGVVRVLFRGLFVRYDVRLTIPQRVEALAMVLPPNAVATDETAAWLHGVDLYVWRDADGLPPLQFFQTGAHDRLRNRAVESGSRQLSADDVMQIGGVLVTTPLRTALDLARLRSGRRGLAALDGLARASGFTVDDAVIELERFKGFRGVVQARTVVPLLDARSDSLAESFVRHDWRRTRDLPEPVPQLPVSNPLSSYPWFLDLALEELRYAAEYDGVEFHSTPDQRERDEQKRRYLTEQEGWTFDILTKSGVFPKAANPAATIRIGIMRARKAAGRPPREHRWPSATAASRPWGREVGPYQRS